MIEAANRERVGADFAIALLLPGAASRRNRRRRHRRPGGADTSLSTATWSGRRKPPEVAGHDACWTSRSSRRFRWRSRRTSTCRRRRWTRSSWTTACSRRARRSCRSYTATYSYQQRSRRRRTTHSTGVANVTEQHQNFNAGVVAAHAVARRQPDGELQQQPAGAPTTSRRPSSTRASARSSSSRLHAAAARGLQDRQHAQQLRTVAIQRQIADIQLQRRSRT